MWDGHYFPSPLTLVYLGNVALQPLPVGNIMLRYGHHSKTATRRRRETEDPGTARAKLSEYSAISNKRTLVPFRKLKLEKTMLEEPIFECEIKKPFKRDGVTRWEWTVVPVREAIAANGSGTKAGARCKHCHGHVKLLGKHIAKSPAPHAVHGSKQDSEYCAAGFYFKQHPGRIPRVSLQPVE